MVRRRASLFALLFTLCACTTDVTVSSQVPVVEVQPSEPEHPLANGRLIRGESFPQIYFHDLVRGDRYPFPETSGFEPLASYPSMRSWYGEGLPEVIEIPDIDIATIPIGGNMTMRPGSAIIKIAASDTHFWVGEGSLGSSRQIHQCSSEIFEEVLGESWEQYVVTVPEVLFADYRSEAEFRTPGHLRAMLDRDILQTHEELTQL